MSVRAHAPDCAKTLSLRFHEDSGESRAQVECTCGATYKPGAATSDEFEHACREASRLERERDEARREASRLERERDEARREAERWRDGCLLEFGFVGAAAKRERPLPWEGRS